MAEKTGTETESLGQTTRRSLAVCNDDGDGDLGIWVSEELKMHGDRRGVGDSGRQHHHQRTATRGLLKFA